MMYLTSAVLKHFEDEDCPEEDLPLVDWACQHLLFTAQHQLNGILRNFPNKLIAAWLRMIVFPLGRHLCEPNDKLSHAVATLLMNPTAARERLAKGAYIAPDKENPVGRMEEALKIIIPAEEIQHRLYKARHDGLINGITFEERLDEAVKKNILSATEAEQLRSAHAARMEVYAVDDFTFAELARVVVKEEI